MIHTPTKDDTDINPDTDNYALTDTYPDNERQQRTTTSIDTDTDSDAENDTDTDDERKPWIQQLSLRVDNPSCRSAFQIVSSSSGERLARVAVHCGGWGRPVQTSK